jgi:hypothetical protein
MMTLAECFPDGQIVATLSQQLSWSHFVEIIALDTPLKRDFYAEMCHIERWSVRTLRQKIDRLLFERTAVAKKPEDLIRADLDALRYLNFSFWTSSANSSVVNRVCCATTVLF